ncbi:unnamed protein product [Gordionus sp. m RMFG-2023]
MSEDPSNDKKFNLQLLETKLKTCNENKDIELKSYIEAYQEIQKFFPLLGKIFYFIYTDVQKKLTILNNFTLDTNKSDPCSFILDINEIHHYRNETILQKFIDIIQESKKIYNNIQVIYRKYNITNIP